MGEKRVRQYHLTHSEKNEMKQSKLSMLPVAVFICIPCLLVHICILENTIKTDGESTVLLAFKGTGSER